MLSVKLALWGGGLVAPVNFNLVTGWMQVVSYMPVLLYRWRSSSRYALNKG
jgi:hypothetical protein